MLTQDQINRIVAKNGGGGAVGDTYSFLPTLNANYIDSLFKAYEGNPYFLNSLTADGVVNGEQLGWKLGGNSGQSYIRRGADALGVLYQPEVSTNDEYETGTQYHSPARFINLRDVADSVGFDLSPYMRKVEAMPAGYRDVDIGPAEGGSQIVSQWFDAQPESQELDEAKAYAALNEQFRDVYRVSGHRDTLDDGGAGSLDFVNSLYRRDGDNLLPVAGTHQFVKGKENSKGFFGDIASNLGPVLPLALSFVPGLQGLATTIGSGLGLTGTAASAIGSGLMGGTLSSLTGGNFGKGFLGGAVGGTLSSLGGGAAGDYLGGGGSGIDIGAVGGGGGGGWLETVPSSTINWGLPDLAAGLQPTTVGSALDGVSLAGAAAAATGGSGASAPLSKAALDGTTAFGANSVADAYYLGAPAATGGGWLDKIAGAVGGKDNLKLLGSLGTGLLAAGSPAPQQTRESKMDPRLDPYVYGDKGVIPMASLLYQNRTNPTSQTMTDRAALRARAKGLLGI